jgi:hypothetical protein
VFEGCGGLEITDENPRKPWRRTPVFCCYIEETDYYPRLDTILVYRIRLWWYETVESVRLFSKERKYTQARRGHAASSSWRWERYGTGYAGLGMGYT